MFGGKRSLRLWSADFEIQGKILCRRKSKPWQLNPTLWLLIASLFFHWLQIDFESWFCVKLCFAPACLELWGSASLILVVNVVGELQPKRTLAASRGFLAAARLSCVIWSFCCCYVHGLWRHLANDFETKAHILAVALKRKTPKSFRGWITKFTSLLGAPMAPSRKAEYSMYTTGLSSFTQYCALFCQCSDKNHQWIASE